MGGMTLATAAGIGLSAVNLLNQHHRQQEQKNYLRYKQAVNTSKHKNLLNQQLASRRAHLGTSGIGSGQSELAVQHRLTKNNYQNMNQDNYTYANRYSDVERQDKQNLLNGIYDNTEKLIK